MRTTAGFFLILVGVVMCFRGMFMAGNLTSHASFAQSLPMLAVVAGGMIFGFAGGKVLPVRPGRRNFFSPWF